eukprot:1930393-Prymnesium_polylepis.1
MHAPGKYHPRNVPERANLSQRGIQRSRIEGASGMEMSHLHAAHRSPLVWAAHPVRLPVAALQS